MLVTPIIYIVCMFLNVALFQKTNKIDIHTGMKKFNVDQIIIMSAFWPITDVIVLFKVLFKYAKS